MERSRPGQDRWIANLASMDEGYLRDARFVHKKVKQQICNIKKSLDKLRSLKNYRDLIKERRNIGDSSSDQDFEDAVVQLRKKLLAELANCTSKQKALEYLFLLCRPSKTNSTLLLHQRDILTSLFGNTKNKSKKCRPSKIIGRKVNDICELNYRRTLWDIFLHVDGSPLPKTWTIPPAKPNNRWEKYLIK